MQQRNHYNTEFTAQTFPITVICENVSNAPNIGALFRICDAFGVSELIFCGTGLPIPSRKMQKTSRATEKSVKFRVVEDITNLQTEFSDHEWLALEISKHSIPVASYTFAKTQPICLVIGDENFGISEAVLSYCDAILHIAMYGNNSSMNVVQATNIVLYEYAKQLTHAID